MKKYNSIMILVILIITSLQINSQVRENLHTELEQHVKYLASDELEGRQPGTDGIEKAGNYIAAEFQKLGLSPINGSYKQQFKVKTGYALGPGNSLDFDLLIPRPGLTREHWKTRKQTMDIKKDWYPLSFSDNKSVSGDLAFVGYGISAPEMDYDDYEGIDVTDKVVIMIMETPDGDDPESKFAPYASNRYKAFNARNKGAVGIIFVKVQGDSMNVFERLENNLDGNNSGIVAVQMNRQSLSKFFPKEKRLIATEIKINETKKAHSFVIADCSVNISVVLEDKYSETHNIMAMIEGTDPALKDEYVIVGAHYDHLGWGAQNSRYTGKTPKIHNGADDNASGTAAVLEIAEEIKVAPLKRSVVFLAFSAEEMGLLGSKYFTSTPEFNLDNATAMINLDMVGKLSESAVTVFGSESSPEFPLIIDKAGEIDSLVVTKVGSGIGPSDHTSFYQEKIPAIHIFTGVHDDYHMPTDDWEKLNYKGLAKIVEFSEHIIRAVDAKDSKLEYHEIKVAEKKSGSKHGYGKVWFGIVPSFQETDKGCPIGGTSPGSPAQKAGLEKDDIIYKIDDTEIKSLNDFMYKIKEHKAGDVLKVFVLRNEKEITFDVELSQRN